MKYIALSIALILSSPIAIDAATSPSVPGSDLAAMNDREVTLKNGAVIKIKPRRSFLTITTPDGKTTIVDPADPALVRTPSPVAHISCAALINWLQNHEFGMTWRKVSVMWMNQC